MRKLICLFVFLLLTGIHSIHAQCDPISSQPPKIKFTGVAPSPWAINGLVNDWETILGPGTGNNNFPYNPLPLPVFNFAMDPHPNYFGGNDLDAPEPASDIKVTAFTHDDYNVYFYMRKLASSNAPNVFYYFSDINADGYMNTGEPVFAGRYSAQGIDELSVYSYVPNVNVDYEPGKGNWMVSHGSLVVDGYTMKGSLQKVFSSNTIPPAQALGANEVFNAAVTENGYGVEFAIPWKYFRNWVSLTTPLTPNQIFTYHVSLQKGASPNYMPQLIRDNAGSCCKKLLYSGNPTYSVSNTTVTTLVSGLSYRLQVTLQNPTNIYEEVQLNLVSFSNIQVNPGMSFSPEAFSVTVNGSSFDYIDGTYSSQPIIYSTTDYVFNSLVIPPLGTATFTINISLPPNQSISALSVGLNFTNARFTNPLAAFIYCVMQVGGGKGINPVGIDITTEEEEPEARTGPVTPTPVMDKLQVYPNPSNGIINIRLPHHLQQGELLIEDLSGKRIRRIEIKGQEKMVVSDLSPGFYILRFLSNDPVRKQEAIKLVVQ